VAQRLAFPGVGVFPRRPTRTTRPIGNKFQEIATRSPIDMRALDKLADLVLERLNKSDRERLK